MIEHVNDLKLQFLVELSKLGDRCATIQSDLADWLTDHDVLYGGQPIPFVLMPHFISPGQLRALQRAVQTIMPVLDRFPARPTPTTPPCARSWTCPPPRTSSRAWTRASRSTCGSAGWTPSCTTTT